MNRMLSFTGLFLITTSVAVAEHDVGASAVTRALAISSLNAIIGRDKRVDLFESPDPALTRMARSTAAIIPKKSNFLEKTSTGFQVTSQAPTHGEYDRLCSGEKFRDQLAIGDCTSFLVAPNLLATAAHCLPASCEDFLYVFDYSVRSLGHKPTKFDESQVAECKEIRSINRDEDWAIVELKKPVDGREPLKIRRKGQVAVGDPLAIIGHPRGLPTKIATGGRVAEPTGLIENSEIQFEAFVDGFGGNSGSPIINTRTYEVEGINTVGFGEFEEEQLDPKTGKKCRRLRTYRDESEATPGWVTRASRFNRLLQNANQ